jgi:large subunit ribosomal protein L6
MKIKNHEDSVEFPEKINITVVDGRVTIKGPKGELSREFRDPRTRMEVRGHELVFMVDTFTKNEKKLIGTYVAHTENMIRGVTEGHEYALKICSGHFPMNVTVTNNQLVVKNFLGEKVPRTLRYSKDVKVAVDGEKITVQGINKELVSQVAASMELLTRRTKFDKRVFQDGIYIVNKDGKEIK